MSSKKFTNESGPVSHGMPARFKPPTAGGISLGLFLAAFGAWALIETDFSFARLLGGLPDMWRILSEMSPPDLTRIAPMGLALLQTFQMAFIGAALGIGLSFVLSIGASHGLLGSKIAYALSRTVISFFRTVPDLVWAIFFVASVGLGPLAGILTIMVDTTGFCGRFFAEAMEEVDKEPQQALRAIGARRFAVIFTAVIPAAMPSFISTSLFALEKAVRASVILGLVGAGGIGIELKAAMDMFAYKEAATVILLIFALVILVERVSSFARRRMLA